MDPRLLAAMAKWAGSANVASLGTITSGVWHGTPVAAAYLGAHASSHLPSGSDPLRCPRILAAARQNAAATGAGDQNLFTLSIPGGTLGTAKGIRATFFLRRTTGAGQVTPKVKYGGTQLNAGAGSLAGPNFKVEAYLWADGATNAQRSEVTLFSAASNTLTHVTNAEALDSTAAQNLTLDVALATTTDVVTLDWAGVEVLE